MWDTDKPKSEEVEREVQARFGGRLGNFGSKYDLEQTNDFGNAEVKADFLSSKTGNIAIEFLDNAGFPSGCAISESDTWIQVIQDRYLVFTKQALWAMLADSTSYSIRRSSEGATNCIIPISVAEKYAKVIMR